MKIISKSEEQTKKIASEFAKKLNGGEVVELIGDLGSGKTTFVRGIVEAMNGKVRVKSPTFTIMNEYPVEKGAIKRVVHLDLYRFEKTEHLDVLALDDERREDSIIFIEWPNAVDVTFNHTYKIFFNFIDENTREIKW